MKLQDMHTNKVFLSNNYLNTLFSDLHKDNQSYINVQVF